VGSQVLCTSQCGAVVLSGVFYQICAWLAQGMNFVLDFFLRHKILKSVNIQLLRAIFPSLIDFDLFTFFNYTFSLFPSGGVSCLGDSK